VAPAPGGQAVKTLLVACKCFLKIHEIPKAAAHGQDLHSLWRVARGQRPEAPKQIAPAGFLKVCGFGVLLRGVVVHVRGALDYMSIHPNVGAWVFGLDFLQL